jgi:maltose O-acetyltransferase
LAAFVVPGTLPRMTERERMVAGQRYDPLDPELMRERARCRALLRGLDATDGPEQRRGLMRALFAAVGAGAEVERGFRCDYGWNITLGERVFLNFGVVVLDVTPVRIGAHTQIGPGAQLIAADHPADPAGRRQHVELGAPITIGENAWIGAGAIVLPGLTVGDDAIVAAGAVATRDVAARTVVAGVPARVVREL